MIYKIRKTDPSLRGTISLTPSKSISNRVLIIQSLCKDEFQIHQLATSNDTVLLQKLLNSSSGILNAEDAGTTFRFLAALLSQKPGEWLLTGTDRMKQRPIEPLVNALRQLGADISYVEKENFPPLKIISKKLHGGEIEIDGSVSSQFISSLLLIAPALEGGLKLKLTGELSSRPYIEMTLKLMNEFGVDHEWNESLILVKEQKYNAKNFSVESDWSAASYWYEMAALATDVDLTLKGLYRNSLQGDSVIAEIMKQFGVETEFKNDGLRLTKDSSQILPKKFSYNFQSCPDLVQTMAVTCAALGVEADFTGVKNLRHKESDRLVALQTEFEKMGIDSGILDSGFQISNSHLKTLNFELRTYYDHRMAMSFAPLALKFKEIAIKNPEVVKKSYPEFWDDLESVGFEITES